MERKTKSKSLHSINIEECQFQTKLEYNINTNHIGIYTTFNYSDPDKKKKYREDNKEKANKYREDNKDKIKKQNKEYYENNKEKISEKAKQYYINKNKPYNKDKRKQQYEKHRNLNRLRMGSKEHSRMVSCYQQGIPISEFCGLLTDQPYCKKFNESLKTKIRDKYNNCDYISGIHKDICNPDRNLDIHHVNYDKNCGCDGSKCKLIPLSQRNYGKTNKNRSFWNRLFIYSLEYDKTYYEV